MKEVYIDKDVNILTGIEAVDALKNENDSVYVSENDGVVRVPLKRWETAQYAEKVHWMKRGIGSIEDRNYYHEENFDNYNCLRGTKFERAIELGSGPFTNLRIIGRNVDIAKCTLLDPLINEYLKHPNCTYKGNKLILAKHLSKKTLVNMALGKYFTKLYNVARKSVNPTIEVEKLIASPVEQMPTDQKYDLVCIINVLEHCYDIDLVFKNILKIMGKGAVFIFNDRYYIHDEVKDILAHHFDAAHPLKVEKKVVDAFLEKNFVPMFSEITHHTADGDMGGDVEYDEIYFIGKLS